MQKNYLNKEDNTFLLMTYYLSTYSNHGIFKTYPKKQPRKYRLIKASIQYI